MLMSRWWFDWYMIWAGYIYVKCWQRAALMWLKQHKKSRHTEISSDHYLINGDVKKKKQFIILALDHASEAHAHASMMCAHISSLTKVLDKEMVDLVLCAVGRPLMQLNIPEWFVNPIVETRPKTTEQEQIEKLKKFILPHTEGPQVWSDTVTGHCYLAEVQT